MSYVRQIGKNAKIFTFGNLHLGIYLICHQLRSTKQNIWWIKCGNQETWSQMMNSYVKWTQLYSTFCDLCNDLPCLHSIIILMLWHKHHWNLCGGQLHKGGQSSPVAGGVAQHRTQAGQGVYPISSTAHACKWQSMQHIRYVRKLKWIKLIRC